MYKELTVFLKNGNTLKFENITGLDAFDLPKGILKFYYVSMSTGKKKYAKLYTNNIAMFSYEVE